MRPARMEDHAAISSFTTETFSWGDYVTRVYKDWLADPDGMVMAAADADDRAVGMAKITMLSPHEAWAQGIRVHPDWRRRGVGSAISRELWAWAAERGARVGRLMIEDWNTPAIEQVRAMGFRTACRWAIANRAVGDASPVVEGNGGRRRQTGEALRRAPSSEAEPAYLSWATGPLSVAARDLLAFGWMFRRLQVEDLAAAARRGALWEGAPGWAVAETEDGQFSVSWLETSPEGAYRMVRALVDAAVGLDAERFHAKAPHVEWLVRALRRAGCEIAPMAIYARAL